MEYTEEPQPLEEVAAELARVTTAAVEGYLTEVVVVEAFRSIILCLQSVTVDLKWKVFIQLQSFLENYHDLLFPVQELYNLINFIFAVPMVRHSEE